MEWTQRRREMQQICHVKVRSPTAWQQFQHNFVCHEEGPSGPLLVHRVPSAPPRWPISKSKFGIQPDSARSTSLLTFVSVNVWPASFWVFWDVANCARPILCADDPEATLLKAHSCTNCITGFHVVSQWAAKTRAVELENAAPGNPVAVRSSKKTLPTLALYSALWTLWSFEHCRLWSETGWPTPNAMRCQWPGSQSLKSVCCQTSARCERVHCQTYLIEHVGM